MHRIIAISGPKTSGKDTAASFLTDTNHTAFEIEQSGERYWFKKRAMAEGVKEICADFFGYTAEQMEDGDLKEIPTGLWPHLPPRVPLMDIANWMRDKYGPNVHVNRWERVAVHDLREAASHNMELCHIVPDLRFPNEMDYFVSRRALIIYISRFQAEEALRLKQQMGDEMALNPSEAHYEYIRNHPATIVVPNNGTLEHLRGTMLTLVKNRFGYPGHWGRLPVQENTHADR